MPTYQYACRACGEELEAVQAFSEASLTECPACGGELRKVFSAVGVVFKGSGFYKNDSRPSGGEKTSDKPAEKKADSATPAAAKTESTPAPAKTSDSSTPKKSTPAPSPA